jgi:homocitrate synthase NifV
MKIKIVDTTLREGEQRPGIALRPSEKINIAKMLSAVGTNQIEAGIPAMGSDEKKYIMKLNDIKDSIECSPDIIHISVPSSDIQINRKLQKNRIWVEENLKRCIAYAKDKGCEVTIGLEDASRAELEYLLKLIGTSYSMGIKRIRYADTVGILYRQRIFDHIVKIKNQFKNIDVEIHTHNDLGMAVSNSISAVKAGAVYVDCTIGGIGERAGNCDYLKFVTAARAIHGLCSDVDLKKVHIIQKNILKIIKTVAEVS